MDDRLRESRRPRGPGRGDPRRQGTGLARCCVHAEATARADLRSTDAVARIMVMSETLPLATVKARFSGLVDRVARQQDRVIVTRNGQPAVVLVSTDDLERLEETLAVMSDRSLAAQIRESKKAAARGEQGASLDDLRGHLEQRPVRRK
jgi:antitoxin YefM